MFLWEHESSKGYADFYMMPDLLHQPDIAYSYIVEVKYAKRDASEEDIASLKKEAAEQLVRYAADEKVHQRWNMKTGTHHAGVPRLGTDYCRKIVILLLESSFHKGAGMNVAHRIF